MSHAAKKMQLIYKSHKHSLTMATIIAALPGEICWPQFTVTTSWQQTSFSSNFTCALWGQKYTVP